MAKDKKGMSTGEWVAIGIGAVIGIPLLIWGAVMLFKPKPKTLPTNTNTTQNNPIAPVTTTNTDNSGLGSIFGKLVPDLSNLLGGGGGSSTDTSNVNLGESNTGILGDLSAGNFDLFG